MLGFAKGVGDRLLGISPRYNFLREGHCTDFGYLEKQTAAKPKFFIYHADLMLRSVALVAPGPYMMRSLVGKGSGMLFAASYVIPAVVVGVGVVLEVLAIAGNKRAIEILVWVIKGVNQHPWGQLWRDSERQYLDDIRDSLPSAGIQQSGYWQKEVSALYQSAYFSKYLFLYAVTVNVLFYVDILLTVDQFLFGMLACTFGLPLLCGCVGMMAHWLVQELLMKNPFK